MLVNETVLRKILRELAIKGEISNLLDESQEESCACHSPNLPVIPSPQSSTQISIDKPPIEDPDYYPSSKKELANALQVIAQDVPDDYVKRFYQSSLDLLSKFIDGLQVQDDEGI